MSRTARNLIPLLAVVLGLACRAFAQAPTFKQYTYVPESSSNLVSITSPAITVAAGDFVVAFCRAGSAVTGISVSSSPSNIWNALAMQANQGNNGYPDSGSDAQASWAIMGSAGSTTFTCTPSSPDIYQSMVVLDYSGTNGSLNVTTGSGSIAGYSWASPAFNTTQGTLNIVCAATGTQALSPPFSFVPGTIGGNSATLRGASASSLTANADSACEDYTSAAALSGATGSIESENANWVGTMLAVNYSTGSPTIPNITWNAPAAVPRGTTLSAAQLNATASVPGTFSYSPAAGTVLSSAGPTNLTVTFTPTNTSQYSTATASVTLMVNNGTPTFKQYTYVSETSSTVASITSPAITVAAGDLVAVVCRSGSASTTSIAASSSPSNTWTATPIQTYNPNYGGYQLSIQASIATMGSSGSTTFTCTPSTAVSGQSMIVLDYSGTGSTVNVSTGGNEFGSPYTTPSFSPTQQALILVCGSYQGSPPSASISEETIAGNTANLRGVSASSLTANADAGCEDYVSTGPLSGITGAIQDGNYAYWVGTALAINYGATPAVTVTPSSSSITTAQALTVTVAVSGSPTPTGSVTLTSGGYNSAATNLSGGGAAINIPAGSLATGTDTLTVTYTPDSNSSSMYNSSTGTSSVTVNGSSGAPTFKQYTYVPESSSNLVSITSPAITVAAGDFVVAFCRAGSAVTGISVSSSPSNIWNALAMQANQGNNGYPDSGSDAQASWAIMGSAGSTTFTCTPSSPDIYQSMVVLDYSGTNGSLNVTTGSGSIAGYSWASPAFNTTQGTLNIVCAATGTQALSPPFSFVPGTIGGNSATLRGASASSLTANADSACEDYTSAAALSGATGSIESENANWVGTMLAVNYSTGSPTIPNITWNAPAAVPRGTTLSAAQLNATASVPGTFSYSPAAGTVLSSAGPTNLTVTFTPTNTSQYSTATASVTLMVNNGTPTFKQYTYVSETSSTVASITSPAITVAAGDLVAVVCRSGSASTTSIAASSSPSNTWTATPIQTYNPNYGGYQLSIQASIATMGSSGSTTFTCTPSTAVSGQSMIVLDYSGTGSTVNVSTGGNEFGSPYTTPSFSPTQQALILVCGSYQGSPPSASISEETIAGNTANLRGVSASSLTANADAGCEDYVSTGPLSGITGAIQDGNYAYWVGTALAINYGGVITTTPTFSPAAGTYTSVQTVTISDTTPGATIYYTTDGSTPTTSSATYSSPISVSTTETVNAIAIASGYGQSAEGSAMYTINSTAPNITSLSPASGPVGTSVTIAGSTFGSTQGSSTVTFNGATATSITSWSGTSIVSVVPTGATTGNVVVTANGIASNGVGFTVSAATPTIASVNPSSGYLGLAVNISGAGFGATQGQSTVTFNGALVTGVLYWSDSSITAIVPGNATTGPIVVTLANGQTSNNVIFTVNTLPCN